jgi:hypothetical protein
LLTPTESSETLLEVRVRVEVSLDNFLSLRLGLFPLDLGFELRSGWSLWQHVCGALFLSYKDRHLLNWTSDSSFLSSGLNEWIVCERGIFLVSLGCVFDEDTTAFARLFLVGVFRLELRESGSFLSFGFTDS